MTLTRTEYYKSDLLSLRYVACRSAEKGMSDVETSDADTLVLPLRGAFIEHFSRSQQVLAEPNVAMIFQTGRSCRVSHPVFTDDDCLSIQFSANCFHEVLENVQIHSAGSHSLLSPGAMAVRNLIWHRLANHLCDALEVEETAVRLLTYALRCSRENRASNRRNNKIPKQIEAAKVVLMSHPERNWSLESLARGLECSPFHLTRMFHQYVGMPLHRYQLHSRLARALDLLLETDRDLTTIALDLGFSSHSHFTASFRQLIGYTPRRLREVASSRIAAEIRKILIAPLS